MCGIAAARGEDAGRLTLDGLSQLEYRGYDSAGIAVLGDGSHLQVTRATGPLAALAAQVAGERLLLEPPGQLAIGHTRWATHGEVCARNAHPLLDCHGHVAIVHNGILDNAAELEADLRRAGHQLQSDVDSELIAHLVERELGYGASPLAALRSAVQRLRGSWAIAMLVEGFDAMFLARQRSPLLVRGTARRFMVASDSSATLAVAGPLRTLDDGDVVELGRRWRWTGPDGASRLPPALRDGRRRASGQSLMAVGPVASTAGPIPVKGASGHADSATVSEIGEQSELVHHLVEEVLAHRTSANAWRRLGLPLPQQVLLLGCGTSYHAALVIARTLWRVAGVPATAVIASELEQPAPSRTDLVIAISQSGETADLLTALDAVDAPVLAITNNMWSSLARRAQCVLDCHAGVERGVAATKSFTAQVLQGVGLAVALAHAVGRDDIAATCGQRLRETPREFAVAESLGCPLPDAAARELAAAPGWLFLGTGSGLPYAAEGALKLKEISYRWAQCYPAAELKHGPLALVESGTPVVVVDNGDARLATAIAEVRSRGAHVIRLGADELAAARFPQCPPWGPLPTVPALQRLAVAVGSALGRDVDRPRNLAKSVTVG